MPGLWARGRYRDTITRPLTDLLVAGYPLILQVAVPRYRCTTTVCARVVFNHDVGELAAPRASTMRRCARYVLRRLMIDRTTISAIATELGVSWHTVSSVAMRAVTDLIAAGGPDRLAGVTVIGVDEHRWAPRRLGAGAHCCTVEPSTNSSKHSESLRAPLFFQWKNCEFLPPKMETFEVRQDIH